MLERGLRSYFDGLDWGMLRRRLMAYLGEQNCVDLLMRWVEGPIRLGDHVVRRTRGLPLGAIISPMLGDLCLDCIDAAVEEQGFRLARDAGDFIVLCKSADDVKRALEITDGNPAHLQPAPAAVPQ